MPKIVRQATTAWKGSLSRGDGTVSAATSGAFALPFSLPSRIGDPGGKTSPEELLAAAHAGCFTSSLAGELGSAGTPPERLEVRCTITMDEVEGKGHQIVLSELEATGRVPGADDASFAAAVEAADAGCPFSTLIRASAQVRAAGRLETP